MKQFHRVHISATHHSSTFREIFDELSTPITRSQRRYLTPPRTAFSSLSRLYTWKRDGQYHLPVLHLVSAFGTSLRLSHIIIPNQAMTYSYVFSHLVYGGMPLARSCHVCLHVRFQLFQLFQLFSTISSSLSYHMPAAATISLSLLYSFQSADIQDASQIHHLCPKCISLQ